MILSLHLPPMGEAMRQGTIVAVHVAAGSAIRPGSKLLDVRVDLGAGAAMDCPPIYHFRVIAGETGWVRELKTATGTLHEVGAVLALISTHPEEPAPIEPVRPLRVSTAAILHETGWAF